MSQGYSNRVFECPFYKWDERMKVHCEGGVVCLPREEFVRFVETYCANHPGWKGCPLAQALNAHYEGPDR